MVFPFLCLSFFRQRCYSSNKKNETTNNRKRQESELMKTDRQTGDFTYRKQKRRLNARHNNRKNNNNTNNRGQRANLYFTVAGIQVLTEKCANLFLFPSKKPKKNHFVLSILPRQKLNNL